MFRIRLVLGAVAALAMACTSEPLADERPAPMILAGDGTMAAVDAMLATPALYWEWSAGTLTTPAAGAVFSAREPAMFTWTTDLVHLDPLPPDAVPVTGVAFLMRFWSKSDPTLLNVFTTLNGFTPDQQAWDLLAGASQPITVRVDSADFVDNRIVEDRGPFYGLTTQLTIQSSAE